MVFTSCIEQPTEKLEVAEQNPKLALVKSWFDTHRYELKIGDSRDSYRTESHELILPFFEKEPDWDKFHIFQFPDGREVYEINLANAELYFPSYLSDSIPETEPNKAVIQNIMFVENKKTEDLILIGVILIIMDRKIIKIIFISFLIIQVGYFISREYEGRKNLSNIRKINPGVSKVDILKLMGQPNSQYISRSIDGDSIYYYRPPFTASSGIEVEFDNQSKVLNIFGRD